ncbi:phage holin, LLH family [Desulfosporosinus sp. SB140]|uniref:phage holin, LLH family n=1 Tax=Desulfosporosinus paludis TaxID=3115649 RepID=UPI00388F046A
MDVQSIISSGLQDVLTILVGALVTYGVAFVKQHFSARQIATASWIAMDAVNFAEQAAKKLGIPQGQGPTKYIVALKKVKELAAKAGLNFTDSQWETFIESACKKVKDEMQPLQAVASSAAPYTQDDIANMIQAELQKVAPNVPADTIESMVKPLIDKALSNLSVSVNVAPAVQPIPAPASTPAQDIPQPVPDPSTVKVAQPVQADSQAQAQDNQQTA